jgi:hypothetical protein
MRDTQIDNDSTTHGPRSFSDFKLHSFRDPLGMEFFTPPTPEADERSHSLA